MSSWFDIRREAFILDELAVRVHTMTTQNIIIGIVTLLVIAAGAYVFFTDGSKSDPMMKDKETGMMEDKVVEGEMTGKDGKKDDTMMEDKSAGDQMMSKGSYETYAPEKLALAREGKVVLYFHADWCPICRPLDAAMKSADIPSGIHILKVNYDTAGDLKQKYGVTYQHTFVQVDASGMQIAKWSDAFTAADVFGRVQ